MSNDDSIARENYQYYLYCRDNGHREFVDRANTCFNFVRNNQWSEQDKAKLKSQGRPALTINKITPTVATLVGEHLANRADITYRPVMDASQEVADVLSKVYLNISNVNKLDWLESTVFERGIITGRAYYDVRVEFDKQMQGEVKITTPRSQNVVLDPEIEDYSPHTWPQVFITKYLSFNDIERLFGLDKANEIKLSAGDLAYALDSESIIERPNGRLLNTSDADPTLRRMYRVIERQHRQFRYVEHFVDPDTGDMSPIPETWKRDHIAKVIQQYGLVTAKRKVESVRWTVTLDRYLLHDDWSPYNEFTIVPFFPYFIDGTPVGIVETLLSPQEMLNKTTSQELHILNTSSNSGWKYLEGSLSNMTPEELEQRGAETGLVIAVRGDINNIEKITPNNVPTGHERLSYKADENIKEISGVSDTMRGMDRADVSSKAITAKQARGSVTLARVFDSLNRSRQIVAERILDLVQDFYTEERTLHVTGGSIAAPSSQPLTINQQTPEGEVVNNLSIGKYAVVIVPAPDKSTFQESQFEQLKALKELGVPVPADEFVAASSVSNKRELAQRMRELAGGEPSQADVEKQKLEQQLAQAQLEAEQAKAQAHLAAAELAKARAEKAAMEAKLKPAEIALESRKADNEQEANRLQAAVEDNKNRTEASLRATEHLHGTAMELTRMDHEKEIAKTKAKKEPTRG